jgi:hypothetical protein
MVMLVLGVNTSTKGVRYALVQHGSRKARLINADGDSTITFEAGASGGERLRQLQTALDGILVQHPVERIALKSTNTSQGAGPQQREKLFLDAIIHLVAAQHSLPLLEVSHSHLKTRRNDVAELAEETVGRTKSAWDANIAWAVMAAWYVGSKEVSIGG